MHMADALLSPAVGVSFMAASGAGLVYSARKLKIEGDERKVPLMGVLGAFVFAAQMINFTIPGTGSSGHIGGGLLLAMLLGPYAAFITIASVIIIQALLFADGGILALGANIWNMGFYPCVVGWFIYRSISRREASHRRVTAAAMAAVIVAVEMGAFSVAAQTVLSGRSELPFDKFSYVMMAIHLPIAIVEGLVTVAVVNFVHRVRPEVVNMNLGITGPHEHAPRSMKPVLLSLLVAALLTGGGLVWVASSNPDGLEWSIARLYGTTKLPASKNGIRGEAAKLQEKTAVMPGYDFAKGRGTGAAVAGIMGTLVVLALAAIIGFVLVRLRGKAPPGGPAA